MGRKLNCWEFKRCGRQPQGEKTGDLGVCPAATDDRLDGEHDGVNAGRACWIVAGTFCNGVVQGSFAQKMDNCIECEFYKKVKEDEGSNFKMSVLLIRRLKDGKAAPVK